MSKENVEVVRAGVDAFVAGDMQRVASLYKPDAKITVVPEGWPEPAPVEGRDAVIRQFARLQEDWEQHSMEIERQVAWREWVVIDLRWNTRGTRSGVTLATNVTGAYRVEDVQIAEARFFWSWDDALEAIGFSEQDAHAQAPRLRGTAPTRSQENVEIVRGALEAWNAGDMDAVRESFDPEIITRTPEGWPEPGPFVGREAVMRQYHQLRETYDADVIEPVSDFVAAGDRVVGRMIWRGAGKGPESNLEWTCIYTVRKGRVLNIDYFWVHAEALEAMGLSEQAPHADT